MLNSTLLKRIKNIDSAKDLKNNCKVFIYDNIFKFFESEGYEVSKIEEIIKLLTVEQQELLHKVYGEDLYNPIKVTSLSRDVLLEFRKVIISIKNRYNYPSEKNRVSINNFYGYYKVYGYSENDVDYVLSKLKRNQLDTLHLFYGEDLHNPIINENISNEEKSKVRALVITTIKNKLEKISNGENIYSEKLDNIYEYYNSLGFSDEKIDTVLMTISQSCMDRLHSYYGEDLKNPVINNNIDVKIINHVKNSLYYLN